MATTPPSTPEADERLTAATSLPDVRERERHEHRREELRRDGEPENPEAEPVALPKQRRERGEHERDRPEIEAGQDDRAEQEREDGDRGQRRDDPRPRRAERGQDEARAENRERPAESHRPLERPPERGLVSLVAQQRWEHEHRQRRGRILEPEVAVRDRAPLDRVPVRLVHG